MTDDRWDEVDALFQAALDRPPDEREAFLRSACGGDAVLLESARSLLSAAQEADGFLDDPQVNPIGDVLRELATELTDDEVFEEGRRIGAYRIVGRIARGGMGTVYEAERADGRFEQRVALKVLRRGVDTEDVIRRFLAERQILASLDHPSIARLLGGGETEDGRPFLVMEYVDGRPIDEYCDAEGLTVDERIDLFVRVTEAVHYAHGQLVIHRDLKPSNILVSDTGDVRLLDFGIAKLLDGSSLPAERMRTRTGVHLLTPEYASPEQIRRDGVATASDVYQLGVLLYRLLTGRLPFADSAGEVGRAARWEDPAAPSAAAPTRALRKRLRGDLDAILLKALREEPSERYRSVEAFANDLRRYRAGRPISVRADARIYRVRKFLHRHRVGIPVAVALVLAVAVYVVTVTAYADRLARERDAVRIEAEKAAQVSDFLVDLFEIADPNVARGETITAREVLAAGAERVHGLDDQPEIQATLLATMARAYLSLGLDHEARPLAERALRLERSIRGGDHPAVVRRLFQLARIRQRRSVDSAGAIYRDALAMAERVHGPEDTTVARILTQMMASGAFGPADRDWMFRRAEGTLRRAGPPARRQLAEMLALSTHGRSDLPIDTLIGRLHEAVDLFTAVGGAEKGIADALSDMALVLESAGAGPDTIDALLARAIPLHREAMGETHPGTLTLMNNRAAVLRDRGDWGAADALYREVLRLRRASHPADDVNLAYTLYGLGRVSLARGEPGEAEAFLREARGTFRPGDPRRHRIEIGLAESLLQQDRLPEAERVLRETLSLLGEELETAGWEPDALRLLAAVYRRAGRQEQAREVRMRLEAIEAR